MSKSHIKIQKMIISALLIAVGIIIPMFSPIKILLEPASFTLASHVAIFIAMFVSPFTAISVALGTTVGFFYGGFPLTVIARAASHFAFAILGAYYLKKHENTFSTISHAFFFILGIGVIHSVFEVVSVLPFYVNGSLPTTNFLYQVIGLTGIGTFIHSSFDFVLSLLIWKSLVHTRTISQNASVKGITLSWKRKKEIKHA